MPKMKKDNMKSKRRDDEIDEDSTARKIPMNAGMKKLKGKKNNINSVSKLSNLKNGNGKRKLKKDLGKAKNSRKEKQSTKSPKVHFDPQTRLDAMKKDESVLFPCGVCGKEVNDNDEAIMCEAGCAYWYHRICTGMGNDAYALLTNEDNAEWVCDHCIASKAVPLVRVL